MIKWTYPREYRIVRRFSCISWGFVVQTRTVLWPFWRDCDGGNFHYTKAEADAYLDRSDTFGNGTVVALYEVS